MPTHSLSDDLSDGAMAAGEADRAQTANVGFIDTHCHFDFPLFAENDAGSLAQAAQAGVHRLIVPAVAAEHFERVLELSQRWPALYAALGLHPLYIAGHQDAHLAELASLLARPHPRLVAVGEIGLDLYMPEPQFERQKAFLGAQLKLAAQRDLPVILHSRRSHDQLAQILRRYPVPCTGVVHGFAGSYDQAMTFIRLGYYIGVGGTITYPRANKTRQAIARLPLDRLLLETDAPDMPVYGFQGQPNRPERITAVFDTLCELRPEWPQVIAGAILANTLRLFPGLQSPEPH
ncbi:putative deoxyribonuclease YjjV [Dickeya solani]|uniref:Hydrolase with metallo-dependent hydrolase domain protein n=2 Tax=Dickeya solani TaxID=1089444 RepID=A0AAV3KFI7_9GAMM|nr:Putative deoxyribonuclease YjjV [Dickeya solani RNS 08.23.3.1.A]AYQ46357.1 putative deoxyribonuclease YjjV [Dickeya solani]ERO59524.1 Putative hydrolase with metallo-dependent hydrolase domain protein [Dickeya solani D s0432-1]AYQ50529.1 putative deoxyribonuclease YjjV [Dickeya solani]MBD3604022.1 deoxyribonuclease YjjV [Dickeya solani]